jgi:hypothetical protein
MSSNPLPYFLASLSPGYQRRFPLNCCGGWLPIPDFGMSEVCAQHDYRYWVGGDAEDRLEADRTFMGDIEDVLWERPALANVVSLGYYLAVRAFGWIHFHYGTPRTHEDLQARPILR